MGRHHVFSLAFWQYSPQVKANLHGDARTIRTTDGNLHGSSAWTVTSSTHLQVMPSRNAITGIELPWMAVSMVQGQLAWMAVSISPICLNGWNLPCVEASLHGWDSPWIEFANMDVCCIRQFVFAWTVVSICRLIYMCQTCVLLAVALL